MDEANQEPLSDEVPLADDILIEDDDDQSAQNTKRWRVLVVDDDDGVHQSTSFAIKGAKLLGREVDLVHAKSAKQAMEILEEDKSFELALVDVMMESKHSGLELAKWMRAQKGLETIRIMLRTGQPGEVSEEDVLEQGEVDDFRLKSELSRQRLLTAMSALLRSWTSGMKLNESVKFMGELARKAASMARSRSREELCVRAAQTVGELSTLEGICVSLTDKGMSRRWILAEGAFANPKHTLNHYGLTGWDAPSELDTGGTQTLILDEGKCLKLEIKSKSSSVLDLFARFKEADGAWSKEPFINVMSQALAASLDALEAMDALAKQAFVDESSGLPNINRLRGEVSSMMSVEGGMALCAMEFDDGSTNADWNSNHTALAWIKGVSKALPARMSGFEKLFRLGPKSVAMAVKSHVRNPMEAATEMLAIGKGVANALGGCDCHAGVAPSVGFCDHEELIKRAELALLDAKREGANLPLLIERSSKELEKWKSLAVQFELALKTSASLRFKLNRLEDGAGNTQWDLGLEVLGGQDGQQWLERSRAQRMARFLGLSSQYDLAAAAMAANESFKLGHKVWIEIGLQSLREPGFMEKMSHFNQGFMTEGGDSQGLGWVVPEDDLYWSVQGYDSWLDGLKGEGFSVALGGFGMGYSALERLGGPWKALRLHDSLTRGVDWEEAGHWKLLKAALSLCAAFSLEAVCTEPFEEIRAGEVRALADSLGCQRLWMVKTGTEAS